MKKTTRLAREPPSGMPTYADAMLVLSRRALLESAASAIRLGIAPPNPSPVRNRAAVSEGIAGAKDVRRERQPKVMSDTTSTTLRPKRSARRPPTMAPSSRPAPLAAKKAERLIGVGCNCRLKPPAVTPAACTSNPSHSAPRKQRPTVSAAVPGLWCSPWILLKSPMMSKCRIDLRARSALAADRTARSGHWLYIVKSDGQLHLPTLSLSHAR